MLQLTEDEVHEEAIGFERLVSHDRRRLAGCCMFDLSRGQVNSQIKPGLSLAEEPIGGSGNISGFAEEIVDVGECLFKVSVHVFSPSQSILQCRG